MRPDFFTQIVLIRNVFRRAPTWNLNQKMIRFLFPRGTSAIPKFASLLMMEFRNLAFLLANLEIEKSIWVRFGFDMRPRSQPTTRMPGETCLQQLVRAFQAADGVDGVLRFFEGAWTRPVRSFNFDEVLRNAGGV